MNKALTALFLSYFLISLLHSEQKVTLIPPRLNEGMENMQVMLDSSVGGFAADIAAIVASSLDKPLFMEGFVHAATQSSLVPGATYPTGKTGIALGSTLALYSENLSLELINRMSTLNEDSDEKTGVSSQPLSVIAELSLEQILAGLRVGANGGYIDAATSEYGLTAWTAGLNGGWHILGQPKKIFRWDGLDLSLGGSFAQNTISAQITPGKITQEITIDIDDDGPLVGYTTILSLNPKLQGSIDTEVWSFNARLATGITLIDSISLCAGAGWTVGKGTAGISIETNEPIEVEGSLGGLIAEDGKGRIIISGKASSRSFTVHSFFLQTGLRFSVGLFNLTIPIIWTPNNGLATGAFAGVTF